MSDNYGSRNHYASPTNNNNQPNSYKELKNSNSNNLLNIKDLTQNNYGKSFIIPTSHGSSRYKKIKRSIDNLRSNTRRSIFEYSESDKVILTPSNSHQTKIQFHNRKNMSLAATGKSFPDPMTPKTLPTSPNNSGNVHKKSNKSIKLNMNNLTVQGHGKPVDEKYVVVASCPITNRVSLPERYN